VIVTPDPAPTPAPNLPAEGQGFARAMITLLLGMGGFLTFGLFAQVLHPAWGLWSTELVLFLGIPFALLKVAGKNPLATSGLGKPWAAGVGFGFAVGAVNFFALAVPLMWVSRQLLPKEVLDTFDSSKIFQNQRPADLFFLIAGVCLAAPVCEEFFFRGTVQKGLMERLPAPRSIVLCGFIFSVFHLDPVGFLARFELGVLFGLLAWRSGSLWPAMAAHFANNLVSSLAYFATKSASDDALEWWVPASMAMAGTLGLLALVRLARVQPQVLTPPPALPALDGKPQGVAEAFFPWALGALLSFGALAAIDHRAITTNAVDVMNPVTLPGGPPMTDDEETRLKALRRQARDGELPMSDYTRERRKLGDAVRQRGDQNQPGSGSRPVAEDGPQLLDGGG
jgi:uncharacterized protein